MLFTSDEGVVEQLGSVWLVLCAMQPSNGCVFVLDGLLLALQAFAFAGRSMLAVSHLPPCLRLCVSHRLDLTSRWCLRVQLVGLVFLPLLAFAYSSSPTLAAVWWAKCALNLGRLLCAAAFVHWRKAL